MKIDLRTKHQEISQYWGQRKSVSFQKGKWSHIYDHKLE